MILQLAPQIGRVREFVFVYLLAQRDDDFFCGAHADVGGEQGIFELAQQLGVNGAVAGEQLLDARGQLGARLADGLLQPLEERWLLLFVFVAEECEHGFRRAKRSHSF